MNVYVTPPQNSPNPSSPPPPSDCQEWLPGRPEGSLPRRAWWRSLVGGPYPRRYSLREIGHYVLREHILHPQAWFHALLFVAMAVLFWYSAMSYWVAVIDDAYITFRYSDHFIQGKGLVYNLGERVEGFTNFTWMVAIGFCIGLGWDPMFCAKIMGLACCLAAMVGVGWFGAWVSGRRDSWNWLVVLPLAYNAHFAHWSMMGLETQLQVALLIWTYARFYKELKDVRAWMISPVLAALAAMTRIESLYYMTPLAAYALVLVARGQTDWRRILRWGLWAFAFFGGYFFWKLTYFGYTDLAPNTYYAKMGDWINYPRGIAHVIHWYLGHGLAFSNLWLIPFLLCLLWPRPATILILGPLFLNAYYVYHVGGDWMPNYRFLQPTLPFLSLLLLLGIRWVQQTLPDYGYWTAAAGKAKAALNPLGYGKRAIAAEAAIFACWMWLLWGKGAPILTDPEAGGSAMLWGLTLGGVGVLLVLRWRLGWDESRAAARARESGICGIAAPLCACAPQRPLCLYRLGLEWALFMGLAFLVYRLAGSIDPIFRSFFHSLLNSKAYLYDSVKVREYARLKQAFSPWFYYYLVLAPLVLGWLARFVSRGRLARSLVRWPIYAVLGLALIAAGREQMKIGSIYLFGREPNAYKRNADWVEMKTIRRVWGSGFSPPLQNVADWMLFNCQRHSTIFMSDIGYPMWLNPDISLIDVDGLTNKHIADAPSVRIAMKSRAEFLREVETRHRNQYSPTAAELDRLRKAAQARETPVAENNAPPAPPAAKTPAPIDPEQLARFRATRPLSAEEERRIREETNRLYRDQVTKRNRRYVLRREPEYCNIFLNHQTNDVKSPGWPYPEISRAVHESPEFKQRYTEVITLNKYFSSWNHIFRRNDVPAEVAQEELYQRLRTGIRRNPRMAYLYSELIRNIERNKYAHDEGTRGIFLQAVRLLPQKTDLISHIAQYARGQKDGALLESALRTLLRVNPKNERIYNDLANHYIAEKRTADAMATLESALIQLPHGGFYLKLAELHEKTGRWDDAERTLRAGIASRAGNNPQWHLKLIELLERRKHLDRAGEACEIALKSFPNDKPLQDAKRRIEQTLHPDATPPLPAIAPSPTPHPTPVIGEPGSRLHQAPPRRNAVPPVTPPPAPGPGDPAPVSEKTPPDDSAS